MLNELSGIATGAASSSRADTATVIVNQRLPLQNSSDASQVTKAGALVETHLRKASSLNDLRTALDGLGAVARDIRAQDAQLGQLSQSLSDAKSALSTILKIYPPLPLESLERAQHLEAYSSYRKIVEDLTLNSIEAQWPPVFQSGNATQEPGQADLKLKFSGGDQLQLPGQIILPGETALPPLPDLGPSTPDGVVADASNQLDALITQVSNARQQTADSFAAALKSIRLAGESLPVMNGQDAAEAAQRLRDLLAQAGISLLTDPPSDAPLTKA